MPLLTMAMLVLAPPPLRIDPKRAPPPVILTVPPPVPVLAPPAPPPAPSMPGTPARPINQATWIGTDDYPASALRREAEGLVRARLVIDLDGVPNDCTIDSSSGHADLDATACALLLARARFHPAQDADGRAVVGRIIVPVRWAIPYEAPYEPLPPVNK